MKRVLIIFFVLMSLDSFSQDPHFSQYCEAPLFLNPANTGLKNNTRVIINYRNQWAAVSTPYQTTALSYDMSLTKDNLANAWLGLGTNIYYDWAGDGNLSLTQGNLNLSGVIRLDAENKLSAGLMGGYGQRSLDYNEFRWQAQYNGTYNPNLNSNEDFSQNAFGYFDAGAGVAWSYGTNERYITANDGIKADLGVSFFHFGIPTATFEENNTEKLNLRYVVYGSMEVGKANSNLTFIPQIYWTAQGQLNELLIGNKFRYLLQEGSHFTGLRNSSALGLGVYYRLQDAIVASLNLDFGNFSVGFSYDFNISSLIPASNMRGGAEVYLKFITPNPFSESSKAKI